MTDDETTYEPDPGRHILRNDEDATADTEGMGDPEDKEAPEAEDGNP